MSDAVNLLVHVGIPEDTNRADNEELVYRDIDIAGIERFLPLVVCAV